MQSAFNDSLLTKDMAESLESQDEEALKQALEELKKQLDNEENMKELSEVLKAAAMNMSDNSALSQALQDIASLSESGSMSSDDIVQSLVELVNETMKNAQGQEAFENALSDLSGTLSKARSSISAVDQRIASVSQPRMVRAQEPKVRVKWRWPVWSINRPVKKGGNGSQGMGAGAGAGDGTTSEDAGYFDGDEPGKVECQVIGKRQIINVYMYLNV